jgi:hypothetical protein
MELTGSVMLLRRRVGAGCLIDGSLGRRDRFADVGVAVVSQCGEFGESRGGRRSEFRESASPKIADRRVFRVKRCDEHVDHLSGAGRVPSDTPECTRYAEGKRVRLVGS